MGSDSVRPRKAVQADWELIYETEKKCFSKYDCLNPRQIKRYLKNPSDSVFTDIIEINRESPLTAGWASFFTRKNSLNIRLYSICILPEYSGKGYGGAYLRQKFEVFGKNFRTMSLEVRKSNAGAIFLYEKLGFIKRYTLPGYYPDGEDGIKMLKIL